MLYIENLVSAYANNIVLKGVSLRVKKGSFTGIIGPNGSGKTTLYKSIVGEMTISSGNIIIDGSPISNISPKDKAKNIAVVTQNVDNESIIVEDYVLMGRLPYRKKLQLFESKIDLEIAHKYMKLTGVYELRQKMMTELSGGEQQLVAIAKALTQEPKILLLDEPTSHLDISHQMQILNLIQRLNEHYTLTVAMIIHDLNLASEYCDYLIMMKQGEIFTQGTPTEVLKKSVIENVYETDVTTITNKLTNNPLIVLASAKTIKNNNRKL